MTFAGGRDGEYVTALSRSVLRRKETRNCEVRGYEAGRDEDGLTRCMMWNKDNERGERRRMEEEARMWVR